MSDRPRARVFVTHGPHALAHYYGARALAELQALVEVRQGASDEEWTVDALVQAAQGCDIVISDRRTAAPGPLFERLPQLVAFCRCAVDIRNVDVAAASAQGVLVTRASAGFMTSVSEWVVGVMIDLARHVTDAVVDYRAGRSPTARMGRELRGATLGLIGYGQIGRCVADLALALGMRVLVHDPHVRVQRAGVAQCAFDELLRESDFVVCLATATPQTQFLMNDAAFGAMKPGALFVNAARGSLVDEAALRRALDAGTPAGCALDVGSAPDQMPDPQLAMHPRVIATPHVGGLTPQATEHQALDTVQQVHSLLQGRLPDYAVNAEHAHRLRGFFERHAP